MAMRVVKRVITSQPSADLHGYQGPRRRALGLEAVPSRSEDGASACFSLVLRVHERLKHLDNQRQDPPSSLDGIGHWRPTPTLPSPTSDGAYHECDFGALLH